MNEYGRRHLGGVRWLAALFVIVFPGAAVAAQCGSALLLETDSPAALDGISLDASTVARVWEVGAASSAFAASACITGCVSVSGAACSGGADCVAITGFQWLNAACSVAGHLPARTAFLLEQTTVDSGGRWVALNVDTNGSDANTDLDGKAAAVCSGCVSTASPYLGGTGEPVIDASSVNAGILSVDLSWTAPPAVAQALSNGSDLVTAYGIYYLAYEGTAPPATGDPAGWTRVPDLQADGEANGGFSTDLAASVDVPLEGAIDSVSVAIGLSFDGTGDPITDANTVASAYISDDSAPIPVPTPCGEANHLDLQSDTVTAVEERVACFTITAGTGYVVGTTGDLTFRAGESVALEDGFSVDSGGRFVVDIDPTLTDY